MIKNIFIVGNSSDFANQTFDLVEKSYNTAMHEEDKKADNLDNFIFITGPLAAISFIYFIGKAYYILGIIAIIGLTVFPHWLIPKLWNLYKDNDILPEYIELTKLHDSIKDKDSELYFIKDAFVYMSSLVKFDEEQAKSLISVLLSGTDKHIGICVDANKLIITYCNTCYSNSKFEYVFPDWIEICHCDTLIVDMYNICLTHEESVNSEVILYRFEVADNFRIIEKDDNCDLSYCEEG